MSLTRFAPALSIAAALVVAPPAAAREGAAVRMSLPASPMLLMQSRASECPANATGYRGTGAVVTCYCPAAATQGGSVWGTDIYTDDSSVCPAARHAGAIDARGGTVTFSMQQGLGGYEGAARNGVSSSTYGPWESSYAFTGSGAVASSVTSSIANCPATATEYRGYRQGVTCYCTAPAAATQGSVWGSGPYTDDSHICRAALHAGVITRNGGPVKITPMPGRASYAGSARNGVSSSEYGSWQGSFSISK